MSKASQCHVYRDESIDVESERWRLRERGGKNVKRNNYGLVGEEGVGKKVRFVGRSRPGHGQVAVRVFRRRKN